MPAISLPEEFIPSITADEVEKVLTDPEWENNVAEASLFAAAAYCKNPKESDAVLTRVINYNVTKKIRELYLEKAKPLPTSIKWDNQVDNVKAYELLEYIVLQFCLMKELLNNVESHKISLDIDNELIEVRLENWCIQLSELYTNAYNKPVDVDCKKLKTKHKYTITIK
jgi:hypothetical protein